MSKPHVSVNQVVLNEVKRLFREGRKDELWEISNMVIMAINELQGLTNGTPFSDGLYQYDVFVEALRKSDERKKGGGDE